MIDTASKRDAREYLRWRPEGDDSALGESVGLGNAGHDAPRAPGRVPLRPDRAGDGADPADLLRASSAGVDRLRGLRTRLLGGDPVSAHGPARDRKSVV